MGKRRFHPITPRGKGKLSGKVRNSEIPKKLTERGGFAVFSGKAYFARFYAFIKNQFVNIMAKIK